MSETNRDNIIDLMNENTRLRAEVASLKKDREELLAVGRMLDAVVEGAQEEFVRAPYGASHEDVAQVNDWHRIAKEARSEFAAVKRYVLATALSGEKS